MYAGTMHRIGIARIFSGLHFFLKKLRTFSWESCGLFLVVFLNTKATTTTLLNYPAKISSYSWLLARLYWVHLQLTPIKYAPKLFFSALQYCTPWLCLWCTAMKHTTLDSHDGISQVVFTPATKWKQHCQMLQSQVLLRQCRMLHLRCYCLWQQCRTNESCNTFSFWQQCWTIRQRSCYWKSGVNSFAKVADIKRSVCQLKMPLWCTSWSVMYSLTRVRSSH